MKFYRLMLWLMIILAFGLIDMAYATESAKKDKSKTDTTTTDATAADTAAASKDAKAVTAPVQKEVQGEISDIGKDYISIVYNQDTPEPDLSELIVGKQRNGPTGTVTLRYNNEFTLFERS